MLDYDGVIINMCKVSVTVYEVRVNSNKLVVKQQENDNVVSANVAWAKLLHYE